MAKRSRCCLPRDAYMNRWRLTYLPNPAGTATMTTPTLWVVLVCLVVFAAVPPGAPAPLRQSNMRLAAALRRRPPAPTRVRGVSEMTELPPPPPLFDLSRARPREDPAGLDIALDIAKRYYPHLKVGEGENPCINWSPVFFCDNEHTHVKFFYVRENLIPQELEGISSLSRVIVLDSDDMRSNKLTVAHNLTQVEGFILESKGWSWGFPEALRTWTGLKTISFRQSYIARDALHLPGWLCKLPNLAYLSIETGGDIVVSEGMRGCGALRSLEVTGPMSALPDVFGEYHALKVFQLEKARVASLPPSLMRESLSKLKVTGSYITSLPPMGNLRSCSEILLNNNRIRSLPVDVGTLTNLTTLDVSNNYLTRLPDLSLLPKLSYLHIQNNMMTEVPTVVTANNIHVHLNLKTKEETVLYTIDLSNNKFKRIPDDMAERLRVPTGTHLLRGLEAARVIYGVDVTNNQIVDISSKWLSSLPELRLVRASRNSLVELPKGISRLEELHVSHNRISGPVTARMLPPRVKIVRLSDNFITRFPPLAHFPLLETLDISHNKLASLDVKPMVNSGKPRLTVLDASYNQISSMKGVKAASFLEEIILTANRLQVLPPLPHERLKVVRLDKNHISDIPVPWLQGAFASEKAVSVFVQENRLVDVFDGIGAVVPRLHIGQELQMDRAAIAGTNYTSPLVNRYAAEIMQMGLSAIKWYVSKEEPTKANEMCEVVRSEGSTSILGLWSCTCYPGFYYTDWKCANCPKNAACSEGQVLCQSGYYLDDDSSECIACPVGGSCEHNELAARPGYWAAPGHHLLLECKSSTVCLGGTSEDAECAHGHTGALCSVCVPGYTKAGNGMCTECPSLGFSVLYLVMLAAGFVAVVAVGAILGDPAVRSLIFKSVAKNAVSFEGAETVAATQETAGSLAFFRVLLGYVQTVSLFPVVFDVEWSVIYLEMMNWFEWMQIVEFRASSISCIAHAISEDSRLSWLGQTGKSLSYTYPYSVMVSAVVLVIAIGVTIFLPLPIIIVNSILKPLNPVRPSTLLNMSIRILIIMLMILYVPFASMCLLYFKCRSLDQGTTWVMTEDVEVQCFEGIWLTTAPLSAFIILIYTIGFPVMILSYLIPYSILARKKASYFHEERPTELVWRKMTFREMALTGIIGLGEDLRQILSTGYKKQYLYWEGIEILRKVSVSLLVLLVSPHPAHQVGVALVISIIFLSLHLTLRPYATDRLNLIQGWQLIMVAVTLAMGLLKNMEVPSSSGNVMAAVLVFMNVLFGFVTVILVVSTLKCFRKRY